MRRIVVAVLMLLMATPLAVAQDATPYTLSGRVVDQDGAPVAGAAVYLYQYGYEFGYADGDQADAEGDAPSSQSGASSASSEPAPMPPEREPGSYHEAKTQTDADGRWSLPARAGWASLNFQKDGYAGAYEGIDVSGSAVIDKVMAKYPDKSVALSGRLHSGDTALPRAGLSIEYPLYGMYVCSSNGDDDLVKPMPMEATPEGAAMSDEGDSMDAATSIAAPDRYPYPGCDITVNDDGTFEGMVYPGYAIIRAYAYEGPGYYPYVLTTTLSGDRDLDINLVARPGPDARLGGHVLDEAGEPVVGAYVSIYNQDGFGGGSTETDKDGSFLVAIHSGRVAIDVWAEGYLPWSGQAAAVGNDGRVTIRLTAGDGTYGFCCYGLDRAMEAGITSDGMAPVASPAPTGEETAQAGGANDESTSQPTAFKDLGGGLGPHEEPHEDSPGLGLALLAVALIVLAARRR